MKTLPLAMVLTVFSGCFDSLPSNLQPWIAISGSYSLLSEVVVTPAGCETGCKCGGSGVEKSGDGLALIGCRCPATCSCKKKGTAAICKPTPR